MWGLLMSNFEKTLLKIIQEEILCLLYYSSKKVLKKSLLMRRLRQPFLHIRLLSLSGISKM